MGRAARRKEERRIERALSSQSANDTQTVPAMQQHLIIQYHPLRHAISWADLSTVTVEKVSVETVPIQLAANDAVIEAPVEIPKQRRKPGPKPKPLAPEVRQAQLWALYADLWDEMEEGMSPKERKALQKALQRNSGDLGDLIEDDTEEAKESRRVVSLVDEDDEFKEEEIEYADFFEDWNPDY